MLLADLSNLSAILMSYRPWHLNYRMLYFIILYLRIERLLNLHVVFLGARVLETTLDHVTLGDDNRRLGVWLLMSGFGALVVVELVLAVSHLLALHLSWMRYNRILRDNQSLWWLFSWIFEVDLTCNLPGHSHLALDFLWLKLILLLNRHRLLYVKFRDLNIFWI